MSLSHTWCLGFRKNACTPTMAVPRSYTTAEPQVAAQPQQPQLSAQETDPEPRPRAPVEVSWTKPPAAIAAVGTQIESRKPQALHGLWQHLTTSHHQSLPITTRPDTRKASQGPNLVCSVSPVHGRRKHLAHNIDNNCSSRVLHQGPCSQLLQPPMPAQLASMLRLVDYAADLSM